MISLRFWFLVLERPRGGKEEKLWSRQCDANTTEIQDSSGMGSFRQECGSLGRNATSRPPWWPSRIALHLMIDSLQPDPYLTHTAQVEYLLLTCDCRFGIFASWILQLWLLIIYSPSDGRLHFSTMLINGTGLGNQATLAKIDRLQELNVGAFIPLP